MEDDEFIVKKEITLKMIEECENPDLMDLIYKLLSFYQKE